jgi:hypothetical protein
MSADQALATAKTWAKQTIAFVVSLDNAEKPNIPLEVMEIQGNRSYRILEQLWEDSIASGKQGDPPGKIMSVFVRKTLDWVSENHPERGEGSRIA